MTITCPVCDNRVFASKDALLQHIKSSSAWHPSCDECGRRFTSQSALDAHTTSKHPPTFDCDICERQYHASFALDDHYRGSTVHPNCIRCGKGFKDQEACNLHFQSSHPKVPCAQCANLLVYEDEWEPHFRRSSNHPTCMDCHLGLKDDEALIKHRECIHPPMYSPSPVTSAKIEEVEQHSTDSEQGTPGPSIATASSPSLSSSMVLVTVPSAGSSVAPSRLGVSRVLTPELRIQPGFFSPLTEVRPPFSPFGPPNPHVQIDNVWTQKANVESNLIAQHRRLETPSTPSTAVQSTSTTRQPPTFRGPSAPRLIELTSRLYQGSARQALGSSAAGPAGTSGSRPTAIASTVQSSSFSYPHPGINTHINQANTFANVVGSSRNSSNNGSYSSSPSSNLNHYTPQSRASSQVGLGRLRGYSAPQAEAATSRSSSSFSFSTSQPQQQQPMRWGNTGPPQSSDTTPTMTRPSVVTGVRTTNNFTYSTPASSVTSNSGSTLYSPSPRAMAVPVLSPLMGSSIWAHSPESVGLSELTGTSPSTAVWPTPYTKALEYKDTNSAESSGPHSPEVKSPVGLALLPTLSPFVTTPVDITAYDYVKGAAEDDITLSYSPIETSLSPVPTVVQDLEGHEQTPASSTCSSLPEMGVKATTPPKPSTSKADILETFSSCMTRTMSTTSTASTRWHANPLHCRQCLREKCDDITATMCGHLFCNRCIVAAVIKDSRCSVCQVPTLLYCLFRLDLAA